MLELLMIYEDNEDRNDVAKSDFAEYSDDVIKKMKADHRY